MNVSPHLRVWVSALRYLTGRFLTIAITIFIGVFITVLISNQPPPRGIGPAQSPFEISIEEQIQQVLRVNVANGTIRSGADGLPDPVQVSNLIQHLREESGLNLPFLLRYLLWTVRALSFNWGELTITFAESIGYGNSNLSDGQDVILDHLPNTLLLVGTAYLITFLFGMPLALYLARRHGSLLDRIVSALSPVSSVPSWVFAILLIAIFAVQLRWFPVGGKSSILGSANSIEYVLDLLRHMALPVLSIVLGLIFQVVYAWRTFFIIYSEEDYVDLARAKGLPDRVLERRYILRPALPYVMTSFATTLIGFWQLTVALEVIFQWPGIGWLYIKDGLPNYWSDSLYTGQLMIVIEIVVIFAYVLGLIVFLLDLAYVIVDPRIHLLPKENQHQGKVKSVRRDWFATIKARMKGITPRRTDAPTGPQKRRFSWVAFIFNIKSAIRESIRRNRIFLAQLAQYPSAVFGLMVIFIMLAGSIYAVTALPYEQVAVDYGVKRVSGKNHAPRVAAPAWTNLFRAKPLLSALILDENHRQVQTVVKPMQDGWVEKTVTFKFDYFYRDTPSEVFLYLEPRYAEKIPYVSMIWTMPDGQTVNLKPVTVAGSLDYDFETGIRPVKLLGQNPEWRQWFVSDGQYPTPAYQLLFAQPGLDRLLPMHGAYQLEVKSLLFEKDSDLYPQLVLMGQVYGLAGTDYWRRDLIIPLLWGMPFALFVGLFGTLLTILVAMLLPAIGVWYGGWMDGFVQRLTEVNMVLPGLTIAVLAYALFSIDIWVVLGIVVVMNAFGAPIKNFRSALLQAKEAPYIEVARSYGASDFRIITRYLLPRIMPVLIPQFVAQVPGFIFLEATLGFFNIKSNYPSWGRTIYEGLSHGAIYGSPYWVLMPISLLLLTGLAFALLGSALEQILNPRMLAQIPELVQDEKRNKVRRVAIAVSLALIGLISFMPLKDGKTLVKYFGDSVYPSTPLPQEKNPTIYLTAPPVAASHPTETPAPVPQASATLTVTPFATSTLEGIAQATPTSSLPLIYVLQSGEYPYCIARRFNVDPIELLALNGLSPNQTFFAGMSLQIPQSGRPFPSGEVSLAHPTLYTVSRQNESIYEIACHFGDVTPESIAEANSLPMDAKLSVGQQLVIP